MGNDETKQVTNLTTTNIAEEAHENNEQPQLTEPQYLQSWRLAVVIFSLCLGTFLMALDINIIGVALPKITTVFNSLNDASWYAAAYLLTVTALQPTMGSFYKLFSIRIVYFANIAIFEVGSILCAAAPSSIIFILGRAVAGIGAAGLLQGALSIISNVVALEKRPAFMGIVISVFGISTCVGPLMGGAFIDSIGWQWCFWINLPIGAVASVILGLFLRVNTRGQLQKDIPLRQKLHQLDPLGTTIFLGLICCLVLALQWGGEALPWHSPTIIGLFVAFACLVTIFCFIEYRLGDNALIPFRILRLRSILCGSLFLFFLGMVNYTYAFYLPFYFQAAQNVSAVTSGIRIIPFILPMIVFVGISGGIVTRFGHYAPYIIAGMTVCCIGTGLITQLDNSTSTAEWVVYLVIAGIGSGTAMQLPYTALQIDLSEADVSVGNGLFVFFNQLGGMTAIPIAQSLFLSSLRQQILLNVPGVDPEVVIYAGPTSLQTLAGSSSAIVVALQRCYAFALYRTYVLVLAAACAATLCACGFEWKNIKIEAERRKALENNDTNNTVEKSGKSVATGRA